MMADPTMGMMREAAVHSSSLTKSGCGEVLTSWALAEADKLYDDIEKDTMEGGIRRRKEIIALR
jgi:hypothetical protein